MNKENLKTAMGSGDDLIGVQVYWTELKGVRVSRPLFRTGIRQCGLGAALADEPKPEAVLNRAVGEANRKLTGEVQTKTKPGYARLKHKDATATYAVLMRRDVAGRMTYTEEARVAIDRKSPHPSPTIEVEPTAPHDDTRDGLIQNIVDQYTEQLGYANTEEVSQVLVRAVRDVCGGLTLRSGLYMVHPDHLDALTALQQFVHSSCNGAMLELWEIRTSVRNADSAKRSATESIRLAFADLLDDVKKFRADHIDDVESAPLKSIAVRANRFKDLDAKVTLYSDILGDYRDTLSAEIAAAKKELLGAFLGPDDVEDAA